MRETRRMGNGWDATLPTIAQIVQFHGFDIFGTQEGKYPQIAGLEASHARI